MFIISNKVKTPDGTMMYSGLQFSPDTVQYISLSHEEVVTKYLDCKAEFEITNIISYNEYDIDFVRAGENISLPVVPKVMDINLVNSIHPLYIYNILVTIIVCGGRVIEDNDSSDIVRTLKLVPELQMFFINGTKYSTIQGVGKKELKVRFDQIPAKYTTRIPGKFYGLYDSCMTFKGDVVTFKIDATIPQIAMKGFLEAAAPLMKNLMVIMANNSRDCMVGCEIAFAVNKLLLIGENDIFYKDYKEQYPKLFEKIENNISNIEDLQEIIEEQVTDVDLVNRRKVSISVDDLPHSKEYILQGVSAYLMYANRSNISDNPDEEYIYRCIKHEYMLTTLYSCYVGG